MKMWSFLYKILPYVGGFSGMNLCTWKRHVWSIAVKSQSRLHDWTTMLMLGIARLGLVSSLSRELRHDNAVVCNSPFSIYRLMLDYPPLNTIGKGKVMLVYWERTNAITHVRCTVLHIWLLVFPILWRQENFSWRFSSIFSLFKDPLIILF